MRTLTTTHQNSILVTWVKAFGRALDAAGCDGSALLAQAGFDLSHLGGPAARCPLTKTGRLWRVALEATGDEAFGVKRSEERRVGKEWRSRWWREDQKKKQKKTKSR